MHTAITPQGHAISSLQRLQKLFTINANHFECANSSLECH
jgi:hypothetical protein